LEFLVQIIDNASNLHHPTINGLAPMLQGLSSPFSTLRQRCAFVLATALQNNPTIQQLAMDLNATQIMVQSLKNEIEFSEPDLEVINKLIAAISSLISHNPKAQMEFWQLGGFQLLLRIFSITPNRLPSDIVKATDQQSIPSIDEDEKTEPLPSSEGKNIIATIDVVDVEDRIRDRAKNIFKLKQLKPVDRYSEWIKLARKVVFVFYKIMLENDTFKLAFAKEQSIVQTLINLLETQMDPELREKLLLAFNTMLQASNQTVQDYIVKQLKDFKLPGLLERIEQWVADKLQLKQDDFDYYHIQQLLTPLRQKLT